MQRLVLLLALLFIAAPLSSRLLPRPVAGAEAMPVPVPESGAPPAAPEQEGSAPAPEGATIVPDLSIEATPAPFTTPAEDSVYDLAARIAWRYVENQYHAETGLVSSVAGYPYATLWDIGSTLGAYYSAHQLGLLSDDEYRSRTTLALRTLQTVVLFDDGAFNKNYQIERAQPAGRNDRESDEGYGWSATDIGRLLVWLKIIAVDDPALAGAASAIVDRLDFSRLVRDGYLRGEDLDSAGTHRVYQEGRIGYEQYAAAGFALWGHRAEKALDLGENAAPLEVSGVSMLTDRRPGAHLTSEPFFLLGIELGWWDARWDSQSRHLVAAQRARFDATGQITIVSEDAIPLPPNYFYYYTVHGAGDDFAVLALTESEPLDGPRWISAKGALAWYALEPGPYTWSAVEAVQPAADRRVGWGSGIFEESGRPTGGQNINTAAVILEAALYHRTRRPLLSGAGAGP